MDLAQLYGRIRTYDPLPPALRELAESQGLDFNGMTRDLYRQLVEEGDGAVEAFQKFMTFENHFWNNETQGSTAEGRLEAQLTVLQELIQYTRDNPTTRLKWAIDQTMLVHNKVFLAQSHEFANISPLADKLHNLALDQGLDAERLTSLPTSSEKRRTRIPGCDMQRSRRASRS